MTEETLKKATKLSNCIKDMETLIKAFETRGIVITIRSPKLGFRCPEVKMVLEGEIERGTIALLHKHIELARKELAEL